MSWTEYDNFLAQARGRKMHDDADATIVQAIRDTGKAVGQQRIYNTRVRRFLKSRGY